MKGKNWTEVPLPERIFSSLHIMIAFLDPEFNFVRVNDAYARGSGHDADFLIGKNHFHLFPNEENERIFRQVLESGEPYTANAKPFEYRDRPELGITYWDWNLQPLTDVKGRVEGLILCLIDVTSRERALGDYIRLAAAVENAREGILILDRQGVVRYANARFVRNHGLTKNDLLGHDYKTLLVEKFGEQLAGILNESFRNGEPWSGQYRQMPDKGPPADLAVTAYPITGGEGIISGTMVVEHDITEELVLRKQIEQKNKMEALGTLAGGVAHDFNNILMPIIVNLELALMEISQESPTAEHLRLSLAAAKRGVDFVRGIISFSRPSSGEKEVIEISSVVREALDFLKSTIPGNIKILHRICSGAGAVLGNPSQIYQILVNLCTNAVDAMETEGGVLRVRLENTPRGPKAEGHVKLTVSDTGCGMSETVIERMFEPFFSTKDKSRRAGMGLSVVHGLVRAHGGFINVQSVNGEGTVFEVFFPRVEAAPKNQSEEAEMPGGRGERILLIDDDEAVLRSLGKVLVRLGYDVVKNKNAQDALKYFLAAPESFDLVITDQIMPDLLGSDLARKILSVRPAVPVILCIGHDETIDAPALKSQGLREILLKPVNIGMIAQTVRCVLDEEREL